MRLIMKSILFNLLKKSLRKKRYISTYLMNFIFLKDNLQIIPRIFKEVYNNFSTSRISIISSQIFCFIFYSKVKTKAKISNKKILLLY